MISIQNLSAYYGKTEVLTDFNMDIQLGESYALIGPSGCGKSTLIKILCGIHKQYSGKLLYEGRDLATQSIKIGYVPQTFGLLDWKTVRENIYLPLKIRKGDTINHEDIDEIIHVLGIEQLLNRYPLQLSGGQRQRVALARAFIFNPDLLLMDEPFSSLDSFTSARSQELYLQLWKKHKTTTLFITHNMHEAIKISKRILLMGKSSGIILDQIDNKAFESDDNLEQLNLINQIRQTFENTRQEDEDYR